MQELVDSAQSLNGPTSSGQAVPITTTIVVLPATCKGGQHLVVPGVSRAVATAGEVCVSCPACAAIPGVDASWRLTSSRSSPDRAELDDEPYGDLVLHRARTAAITRQPVMP